jgi:hypothetical protein
VNILLGIAAAALTVWLILYLVGAFCRARRYVRIVRRLREARVRHVIEWGEYPSGDRPRFTGGVR